MASQKYQYQCRWNYSKQTAGIQISAALARSTNAGPPGAKDDVELDVTLNAAAGFVVFTPKALSIPILEGILPKRSHLEQWRLV